jgi:hypothetical protein
MAAQLVVMLRERIMYMLLRTSAIFGLSIDQTQLKRLVHQSEKALVPVPLRGRDTNKEPSTA